MDSIIYELYLMHGWWVNGKWISDSWVGDYFVEEAPHKKGMNHNLTCLRLMD